MWYLLAPPKHLPVPQVHPCAAKAWPPFQQHPERGEQLEANPSLRAARMASAQAAPPDKPGPSRSASVVSLEFTVCYRSHSRHLSLSQSSNNRLGGWGVHTNKTNNHLLGIYLNKKLNDNKTREATASALLKERLKGNPEISLQFSCFQEVVRWRTEKTQNHQYAPVFPNSKRGRAGQKVPSSTQLHLTCARQAAICQQLGWASQRSLPASKNSPSPPQGFKTSAQPSPSPFQAIPTPSTSSGTSGAPLATGDVLEGN